MLLRSLKQRVETRTSRNVTMRSAGRQEMVEALQRGHVMEAVLREDRRQEQERMSMGEYTHVSSLIGMCPRQHALAFESGVPIFKKVTGGHRVMWIIGKAVEKHIRTQFINGSPGTLYGGWHCNCGRWSVSGLHREVVTPCLKCGGLPEHYHELPMYDHSNKIVGSPDLPFIHNRKIIIGEIKSVRPEDFDTMERPIGNHVFQAAAYRRLYKLNGFEVDDLVSIVYCTKRFRFGTPYKEFHEDVSVEQWETQMDRAWELAGQFSEYQENRRLPSRVICNTPQQTRARNCPMIAQCFGRNG